MVQNDRMPSISVGIIVPAGASYDTSHHWPSDEGVWHAPVRQPGRRIRRSGRGGGVAG